MEKKIMLTQGTRYIGQEGCYAVSRLIGRGAYGLVYEAWDVMVERRVVIKQAFANTVPILLYEARMLSLLHSLSTVPRFIELLHEPEPLLLMQLRRGRPLFQWQHTFCGARVPFPLLMQVGYKLARAVEGLHALGMAHGDLHVGNVLFHPEEGISLLDFGCARLFDDDAGQSLRRRAAPISLPSGFFWLGAKAYAAPERFQTRRASAETDMYSLGVLLYELAAGKLPGSLQAQPLPRCLWNGLGSLIRQLLHPDPLYRPTAAATVAELRLLAHLHETDSVSLVPA